MQGAAETGEATPAGGLALRRHLAAAARRRAARGADGAAQAPLPVAAPSRPPERLVSSAIGRAAERVHGLPLFFDKIEIGRAALAELAELLPERALISVIEGPAEALGAVAICPGLLAAVIEMQAVGRVSSRAAPGRRPTRTDAAICADFLNACLAELGDELGALAGFERLRGFRYASFLDDPRPLGLMLEDTAFHLVSIRLRAGDAGQRDGRMVIALPAAPACAARTPVLAAAAPPLPAPDVRAAGAAPLAEAVRAVPIELVGVLCRRMISLGALRGLSPGDTIALPADVLGGATLETAAGQILFRGKLGEVAGRHALRLAGGPPVVRGEAAGAWIGCEPPPCPGLTREPPIADLDSPDVFRADEASGGGPQDLPEDPVSATL